MRRLMKSLRKKLAGGADLDGASEASNSPAGNHAHAMNRRALDERVFSRPIHYDLLMVWRAQA
jgi:hypothetical protein